jgi:pimeloyl-ACP methyl ester carboxylesterase
MKTRKLGRWLVRGLVALVLVYFAAALALSAWPAGRFASPADGSPEAAAAQGLSLEQVYAFEEHRFPTRDGETLYSRFFAADEPALTLLIVHGMTGESRQFNRTAGLLREATGAEVYALDLRGHGESGGRAGDVDHIGQYEEDLVDAIASLRERHPGRALVLSGHSMGGGIAQRYAQRPDAPAVDGYLLYAPLLGFGAPTTRTGSSADPDEAEPWLKLNMPRLIGLSLLNTVGVTGLNGLTTAVCHVTADARVGEYTFRGLMSGGPPSYVAGLEALDAPLLLVVGREDEAFLAEEYGPVVEAHVRVPARVEVVDGANHNGVHHDPRAVALVADWLSDLGLSRSAPAADGP